MKRGKNDFSLAKPLGSILKYTILDVLSGAQPRPRDQDLYHLDLDLSFAFGVVILALVSAL